MSLTGRVGLGPVAYQVDPIRKCDEKVIDSCKTSHKCCAVISCEYCLEWEAYGEDVILGDGRTTSDGGISGTVAGMVFRAEWQRGTYTDQCELWVYIDDVLQAIIPLCGDVGVTCRNMSYTLHQVVIQNDEDGYETIEGEFRWIKSEKRPLPYRKDDTLCTQHFCGKCECTCKTLCIRIEKPYGTICQGTLPDMAYNPVCDGPMWIGDIECTDDTIMRVSIGLTRDLYDGTCLIGGSFGDEEQWIPLRSCTEIEETFTLSDGSIAYVTCAKCDKCDIVDVPCCRRIMNRLSSVTVEIGQLFNESDTDVLKSPVHTLTWEEFLQKHIYYDYGGPCNQIIPNYEWLFAEMTCETDTLINFFMALNGPGEFGLLVPFQCGFAFNCEEWDFEKTLSISNCHPFFDNWDSLPSPDPPYKQFNLDDCGSEAYPVETETELKITMDQCGAPVGFLCNERGFFWRVRFNV
jgi:hypothetical protein